MTDYRFDFAPSYQRAARVFGITPSRALVQLKDGELRVRFGPWRMHTSITNVVSAEVSGPYAFIKTAGPPHLSAADRGVTFATNGVRGLCLEFREPVPAIDFVGLIRHPNVTLTLADIQGFERELKRAGGGIR